MKRKGLRRLDLYLPDNHFIWRFNPGCRGPVARAYLNLLPVLAAQAKLLEEILRRLEALDERLARLEAGGVRAVETEDAAEEFDAAGFFASFD